MVLGLILLLHPTANKTWLKNPLHFAFWDRIFTQVIFYQSSFFIPSFRHQDLNSYYLVVATSKTPEIWKRTSMDVYISICNSEGRTIHRQWIIQPKPIDCSSAALFSFVIAPAKPTQPSSTMLRDNVCQYSLTPLPTLLLVYRGLRFLKNLERGINIFR